MARQARDRRRAREAASDIVITTALIPGRPAPKLVKAETRCKAMKPGSVIVDLAAEQGGNVEGTELGKIVVEDGVQDHRPRATCRRSVATDASALYARNVLNFLALIARREDRRVRRSTRDDEIVAGDAW